MIDSDDKKYKNYGVSKIINFDKYQFQKYQILNHDRTATFDNLVVFSPVYNVLRGLFKNSIFIDDIQNLTTESFIVFSVIVEKKFKVKITNQKDMDGICQLLEVIKNRIVDKRPEECKKIILTYTIKQLKYRLREQYSQQ